MEIYREQNQDFLMKYDVYAIFDVKNQQQRQMCTEKDPFNTDFDFVVWMYKKNQTCNPKNERPVNALTIDSSEFLKKGTKVEKITIILATNMPTKPFDLSISLSSNFWKLLTCKSKKFDLLVISHVWFAKADFKSV